MTFVNSHLDEALRAAMINPAMEFSGMGALVFDKETIRYEQYFGLRRFSPAALPVDANTRWRVASMSKPVTALGAMVLIGRGLLDPDKDISEYLGFSLRNPHFPNTPITARQLCAHTSSLRDANFYYPPLTHKIRDLFIASGMYYDDGAHFAKKDSDIDRSPGHYYCYCNLGYGVLATAMECITRTRFDIFMHDEICAPLRIDGGFNVNLLSDAHFDDISPLYRKSEKQGKEWVAQIDNYNQKRPVLPVRTVLGSNDAENAAYLDAYIPGENGSLFSPQGGLRICLKDMAKIAALLACGGEIELSAFDDGPSQRVRIISEQAARIMHRPVWVRTQQHNGDVFSWQDIATGWGLIKSICPRADKKTNTAWWGHHGNAYGFLGAMQFDAARNAGYVYCIGGSSGDPEEKRNPVTGLCEGEHEIRTRIEHEYFS